MDNRDTKKCKCGKTIDAKYNQCRTCQKNDPYRGWYGVYEGERRKKVR